MPRVSWVPLCALALPLLIGTGVVLGIALGESVGAAPFSVPPPRNSAEAAAIGDAATVLRMIQFGNDPTRIQPLRPELISSTVRLATTLEAAVWSRQVELIRVLDRHGAIVGPGERQELGCLALDLGAPDIVEYLAPKPGCVTGAAMERVLARSRPAESSAHE